MNARLDNIMRPADQLVAAVFGELAEKIVGIKNDSVLVGNRLQKVLIDDICKRRREQKRIVHLPHGYIHALNFQAE